MSEWHRHLTCGLTGKRTPGIAEALAAIRVSERSGDAGSAVFTAESLAAAVPGMRESTALAIITDALAWSLSAKAQQDPASPVPDSSESDDERDAGFGRSVTDVNGVTIKVHEKASYAQARKAIAKLQKGASLSIERPADGLRDSQERSRSLRVLHAAPDLSRI